jgi:hypothetical protein
MEAKVSRPILLVSFPISVELSVLNAFSEILSNKLTDEYHVFVYKDSKKDCVDFRVLNAIDATDIEIVDLIKELTQELNSFNTKKVKYD